MCNMSYKEQAAKLAGPIALLKAASTRGAQDTARDAVQVFGGRGITRTGMGRFIEHVRRRCFRSAGGSGARLMIVRGGSITGRCRSTRCWAEVRAVAGDGSAR
jgi:alkylation response protein AidB-like acyl-CoA dehydrogenase